MRFQFSPFGSKAPRGAVACDGLVQNADLDLSHWSGNQTPLHLKDDTSVEIALAFARERAAHDVEVVTNNHYDTDGVLATWSVLRPELALLHRDVIVGAAECGDFDAWPSDDRGIWLDAAIGKITGIRGDDKAYQHVLPMLDLVPAISTREDLWGEAYRWLLAREAHVKSGQVSVEREGRVAVFVHDANVEELPGAWIHRLMPENTDRLLIAFKERDGSFRYRYELPRYAWADTVRRPKLGMPRRGPIKRALGAGWVIKGRLGMTGLTYTNGSVADDPRSVARTIARADVSSP